MSDRVIDFYYSLMSPWTYLGMPGFLDIVRRHGAAVRYKPMDLGKVFPASGGLPVAKRAPQRQAYRLVELERWRKHLDMPINLHPKHFPAPDDLAARMVIAAQRRGHDVGALTFAILRAVWAEERDVSDPETLSAILEENKLNAAEFLKDAESEAVKQEYVANAREALDRGVFGSPSYIYKDELFWGQDRLDFLDRALQKAAV